MKIFHIESGLGNQMLDYCDLLACKKVNNDSIYIENIIYELNDHQNKISMWNGYELERIFGIKEKNIKDLFTQEQWHHIITYMIGSRFWENNWNYSEPFIEVLCQLGIKCENLCNIRRQKKNGSLISFKQMIPHFLLHFYYTLNAERQSCKYTQNKAFCQKDGDFYAGHYLQFMYKGSGIEQIHNDIKSSFKFPDIEDDNNSILVDLINKTESVAVHIRRGDFLPQNYQYYKNGYYKRAVNYIKKHCDSPVFFVFCDPESHAWARENEHSIGFKVDDLIHFVHWNNGKDSYKDMQLMSMCKHNIITNSSFGWWGAYLNDYPDKITCSSHPFINTTHWF